MTSRSNANRVATVLFDDGEIATEKFRNSIGGFANAAHRLEARFGGRLTPLADGKPIDGTRWTLGGRPCTIEED